MKQSILLFIFSVFLNFGLVFGQDNKLNDPENLLTRQEKAAIEAAVNYISDFYSRIFTDKTVYFSDIKFTIIPNYIAYMLYQAENSNTVYQSAGYYSHSKRELVVCNDKDKFKNTFLNTCFHELSHALLHQYADEKNIPAWFNEGLAVYFAKMTYSSRRVRHQKDTHQIARLKTLIELREINLAEFVDWDYHRFSTESFTQESYGYAIGYGMVYFLMKQKNEAQVFEIFRNLIGAESTIDVFDSYYEGGFAQFEKDFMAYFS